VTPEIAARLKRGEDVSPEEIAAASAQAESNARMDSTKAPTSHLLPEERLQLLPEKISLLPEEMPASQGQVNEWLPESITGPKKRTKGKRR